MMQSSAGEMNDISKPWKGGRECTPRLPASDMTRGPLPGSTRWRNRYRCASPVVAVDPSGASGCQLCSKKRQIYAALYCNTIIRQENLNDLKRYSQ
jgi:hypothetical protein